MMVLLRRRFVPRMATKSSGMLSETTPRPTSAVGPMSAMSTTICASSVKGTVLTSG